MLSDYYKELYKPEIIKLFNKEIETFQNLQKDNVIGHKITLLNPRSLKNNVDFKKILENNAILNKNSKNLDKINENFEKDIEIKKSNRDSQKVIVTNSNNSANIKENIKFLMMCEGRIADYYWKTLSKVFNNLYPEFNFKRRNNSLDSHNRNASDYVNALLNYGYAILESVIRKDINVIGLDPDIGFLHEINPSKQPLVYDLQELYRWLIDLSIIQVLEEKKLKKSDFIVTENYHIRLRESAARQLLGKITLNFNKRTLYKGKMFTYESILLDNVRILANYVIGRSRGLKFGVPKIEISRNDTNEVRDGIISITPKERKSLGINKSTLWYQQKAIREGKKIKLYNK
jgi:CRISPR-associated protein Cas1